jgi:hypothetical protein
VEDRPLALTAFAGAEVRCASCGGHLGDVFLDGFLFPNTPAASTGMRYCIDGAALVFEPSDGSGDGRVWGDSPLPEAPAPPLPSWLQPPPIRRPV